MKAIGYMTTTVAVMAYAAIMNGWALAKLWSWFFVTGLNAPAINIPTAIGICLTVSFLTKQLSTKKDETPWSETLLKSAIIATINPLFVLGVASIVKVWL